MTPFWYVWPSWPTELLGGAALGFMAALVTRNVYAAAAIAMLFSVTYERFIDRNGWSWTDVGQRAVGIAAGLALGWWAYV